MVMPKCVSGSMRVCVHDDVRDIVHVCGRAYVGTASEVDSVNIVVVNVVVSAETRGRLDPLKLPAPAVRPGSSADAGHRPNGASGAGR